MMAGVRISSALIANYAESRAGVLNILGAFPEWWEVPKLPWAGVLSFVVVLELAGAEDAKKPYKLDFTLRRPTGESDHLLSVQTTRVATTQVPGAPFRNAVPVQLPITLGTAERHSIVVSETDTEQSVEVPFGVRLVPPPPASQ